MERSDLDRSLMTVRLSLGGVSARIFVLAWLDRVMRSRQVRSRPPRVER